MHITCAECILLRWEGKRVAESQWVSSEYNKEWLGCFAAKVASCFRQKDRNCPCTTARIYILTFIFWRRFLLFNNSSMLSENCSPCHQKIHLVSALPLAILSPPNQQLVLRKSYPFLYSWSCTHKIVVIATFLYVLDSKFFFWGTVRKHTGILITHSGFVWMAHILVDTRACAKNTCWRLSYFLEYYKQALAAPSLFTYVIHTSGKICLFSAGLFSEHLKK
jgi:hypothetical protein